MNSSIPGFQSTDESFAVLQHFWWLRYSFINHLSWRNEYFTAYPFGIQREPVFIHPLWFHISRYLSIITNEIVTYNLIVLFNLIVSSITMYYLVNYLVKNRFASFFSGIIYALCPYQFSRLWQHFSLTFSEWMPLYILALIKLYEQRKPRDILFCIFAFFLVIAFDYHYGFFMLITTTAFILYTVLRKVELNRMHLLRIYMVTSFLIIIILLITILPSLKTFFSLNKNGTSFVWHIIRPFQDLFLQSARPLSYLLPAAVHPLFGRFTEMFIGSPLYGVSFTEHALYLGWIPLILAFVAFKKWKRIKKLPVTYKEDFYIGFFVLLAIIAWILSQPPWWKIGPIKIYMPSFFIYKILPMFRAYCRFGIVVMLGVSVLAGFGLKFISEKFKSQRTKIAITCLFSSLVLFEFWNYPPFKVINVSAVPGVYYWLKEQPGDFTIAEYPLDINGSNEMYKLYQTKHRKRIINGTVPGTYANKVAQSITKLSQPNVAQTLKSMKVKYVLVHRQAYIDTGLIEWIEELNKIPQSPHLKFIKGARGIDVYEVSKPK